MTESTAEATQQIDAPAADGVDVHEAQLQQAGEGGPAYPPGQIDILLDTTVPVSASLGQVDMEVRQLLQLGKGSVVRMDTKVGELVDLYLRGILFARGRLVVVGENLGVRVEEIVPQPAG